MSTTSISQCYPFTLGFHLDSINPSLLPLSLQILPFNSSNIINIPIPINALSKNSVSISFIPFPAGTSFIAAFQDNTNSTHGSITNIIQIQPSSNSSCLQQQQQLLPYAIHGNISQCNSFNLTYNNSLVTQPPQVRAFSPQGYSLTLNLTNQPTNDIATYLMAANQADDVILLFDDLQGHRQTTSLLDIGPNNPSNNSTNCVPYNLLPSTPPSSSSSGLSKDAITAIVVSTSGVLFIALLGIIWYLFRDRRRRQMFSFPDPLIKVNDDIRSTPPPRPSRSSIPPLFPISLTTNPPYTAFSYMPEKIPAVSQGPPRRQSPPVNIQSMSSIDIENILNSATFYHQNKRSSRPSDISVPRSTSFDRPLRPSDISFPYSVHLAVPTRPEPSRLSILSSMLTQNLTLSIPHGVSGSEQRLSYLSNLSNTNTTMRPPVSPRTYTGSPLRFSPNEPKRRDSAASVYGVAT